MELVGGDRSLGAAEGGSAVGERFNQFVRRRERGVGEFFVHKLHCVAEPLAACGFDVAAVDAIVLGGRADIPAVDGVERPRPALVRLLVDLDVAAHRGEGHAIVIKRAIEVGVGRDGGRGIGLSEEVDSDLGLGEEAIPQIKREVVGNTGQDAEEVGFEVADGDLGSVASVAARGDKLNLHVVLVADEGCPEHACAVGLPLGGVGP